MATENYDVIVVGTGFASSFFLHSYLKKAKPTERILVLERGFLDTHAWQLENASNSRIDYGETYKNANSHKDWQFNIGFGGGSNCWWANTPRFLPSDFELKSRYGVGRDWPVSYDDLEPYYQEAEEIMAISGPSDDSPHRRSGPYPQPPHVFSDPDRLLKSAHPELFFHMPTARARVPTQNRPRCCATGVCYLCPIDAKFTIQNEMQYVYSDDRITLELGAQVETIDLAGGVAKGITFRQELRTVTATANLVVLGANALFNAYILLNSGRSHPLLGKRLNEQVGITVNVDLAGVENYGGSTSATGISYVAYDGPHRSQRAAIMVETTNTLQIDGALRLEDGKWRQRLVLGLSIEDLPNEANYVTIDDDNPEQPRTVYTGYSDYARRSIDALPSLIPQILEGLPIDGFTIGDELKTVAHIQGTTVMGNDPAESVVDRFLVDHEVRNLLILGSGAFPTCPPPMPTLTLSALSLWAVDHL
jgi:choline dehydrogenase-like flavoprotein